LHAQRSAGGDCSVSSGVLPPGFIQRGVGVWKRTFATATRRCDRLAHTALILGGLPALHRHVPWRERRGVIRPRVRGRPTAAPAPGPVWPRYSTMTDPLKHSKRIDSKPPTGQSAVAESASDALPPTAKAVGFRAVPLYDLTWTDHGGAWTDHGGAWTDHGRSPTPGRLRKRWAGKRSTNGCLGTATGSPTVSTGRSCRRRPRRLSLFTGRRRRTG